MDGGLVDLSLFADFPINDHHFAVPQIPTFQSLHQHISWSDQEDGGHHQQAVPLCTMKPLPPLPRRPFIECGFDPRRYDGHSRCILSRMKRSLSDNHAAEISAYHANTIQQSMAQQSANQPSTIHQRRLIAAIPQLTLSSPSQHQFRGRPASPMVWMPDEQMWLIVDDEGFRRDHSTTYPGPSTYSSPRYARSEPSPRQHDHDFSPIRTQFMTLIRPQLDEERLSPLFQEAIHGVSMYEYGDPNEPPTFQSERDWRVETTRRESWQTAIGGISPLSRSQTQDSSQWTPVEYSLGYEICRPLSTN